MAIIVFVELYFQIFTRQFEVNVYTQNSTLIHRRVSVFATTQMEIIENKNKLQQTFNKIDWKWAPK